MTRFARFGCGLLLGAFLLGALGPTVSAQQMRTLTIQDGTVYIDDHRLSADQIPNDLNLEGVTAQYQFVGIRQPVVELNGRLFAVENGLQPVSEEDVNAEKSSVILRELEARSSSQPSSEGRAVRAQSASSRSVESARAAQERYLSEVEKANRELYRRLVRERTLEKQAQNLARVIRMLPEGSDERQGKADSLRALLNNIFDLKQENRRREIERLQRQIQELQGSLQKRKRMRGAMIDQRFNQLLNTPSGR